MSLTLLYDAGCPLCSRFRDWLVGQPLLVSLEPVAAGSAEARRRFPTLDHAQTLVDVTVVGDTGEVWTREHAWVMCLWATHRHRALAERLARPAYLPLARGVAASAAGLRHLLARPGAAGGGDYPERCAGTCRPLPQG
ncbi:DCC1-like thiol-disulfide oxidoreductase family protein [Nocardioides sp. SYSU D00038]|uniref:DCC1-like thiol-disulfide oxidoreductase family protein n=1 Tax=Nocardioides sp. SYSU D00038 TaxID=2812554 RepID=UPI001966ECAF|nr:DCC1-like thiol-disulfide oxidoreductase family protein [Nocardioides sp. SYSU D00038]